MSNAYEKYYVPEQSPWPFVGAVALFLIAFGAGHLVNEVTRGKEGYGSYLLIAGVAILIFMLVGWFRNVIDESMSGLYSKQMDRSFRQGMSWFIFSEVMFFFAFFGALFYARLIAMPWLDGASNNAMTAAILWPDFSAHWPMIKTPGGTETTAMPWQGLPLYNTIILLTSSVTLQFAHTAMEQNKRGQLKLMLLLTVLLGATFLVLQGYEYMHAYQDLGLKLDSGIYGNTFFLLTGFHGMHVTLGAIFLLVMLLRIVLKNHFTAHKHFAFQAAAWYWHFVDVVWLCLFVFVYVL
ncbi:MAG: cytochrome c oxidase subunit 3 [Gammaproteobacteria bacterium]|jgi:cytochrome c oxidase subunit III|nr:cytochrome c oxidase subunit 3 [Gammaproteobacteria bacterium]MBU2180101.1 cytochrome c oxidase subunit 3 [Gammaproteobacteria bacterium]MBU2224525.1 cytochrome c oxidase subunit 3 [Gammaproteobacteria bacterium]MBU2277511.1 cytochrome c oxidase subunit 3 [Gammaproteobacteria bacterium]MBU2425811.1 cytochrome c oxidase subunit 3 [Gammaproteobacteria bacterium]